MKKDKPDPPTNPADKLRIAVDETTIGRGEANRG